ncbi:MAG: hypothetical protein OEY14_06405 [Myxococcales bacterium]|nr:hypothetical protein [Myxococcales bacterium]
MASAWKVLPNQGIERWEENLWRVRGALPDMALERQMLVARTQDGRLVIHNGIALEEEAMAELEAFGEPSVLIVPNRFHRLDAPRFKARYPNLKVYTPAGARRAVQTRVPVDGTYDELPELPGVQLEHLRGVRKAEGVMRVESEAGVTLILNDCLFNQPHLPGLFGAIYRLLGQSGAPKVTAIARLFLVQNKAEYADHLRELAEIPGLIRVVPAHIDPILEDPAGTLRGVADALSRPRG